MMHWTLGHLSTALAECLVGARPIGSEPLGAVSTDSRTLRPGDIFVALVGERFDGHAFVPVAVERGAAALVVSHPAAAVGCGRPVYVVADTTVALGHLGRWWRRVWGGRVVAVAGSNGKTSTKAMLASVLGTAFQVYATRGNLNNQVGVPHTLLEMPMDTEVAVVEIGTNHPGEVAALRALVLPDVAVIASIGEEHLEGLGSLDGVLREEASIAIEVPVTFTPAGQPQVGDAVRALGSRVVEVGLVRGDCVPTAFGLDGNANGWLDLGGRRVTVPLAGEHNLRNAMLAVAVGRYCGLDDAQIVTGIEGTPPQAMRSSVESVGTLRIFNDAYNANPASAREAIATFDAMTHQGQRVMILGSMLELGAQGPGLHDEIALRALASRADVLGAIGEFVSAFERVGRGDVRVVSAVDAEALWPVLSPRLRPDALIMLKGSRGTRLERLLAPLHTLAGVVSVATDPVH